MKNALVFFTLLYGTYAFSQYSFLDTDLFGSIEINDPVDSETATESTAFLPLDKVSDRAPIKNNGRRRYFQIT